MSNAECVKRYQQKQKKRLEEAEAEVARLKSLDHGQILADAAARKLLDAGAENYVGDVYTITVNNGETFEIVVTTQRVGAKSPHELHAEVEAKLAAARSVQTWQDAMEEYSDEEGNCPWSSNKLMQDEIDALRAALGVV